jgi:hypothetical protein
MNKLEIANLLYQKFRTRCFWHCPKDLVITEDLLDFVIKGLRTYGGREGFIAAGQLRRDFSTY